jgi:hypothetical protein
MAPGPVHAHDVGKLVHASRWIACRACWGGGLGTMAAPSASTPTPSRVLNMLGKPPPPFPDNLHPAASSHHYQSTIATN